MPMYTLGGSTTQAQSAALVKRIRPIVSTTQGEVASYTYGYLIFGWYRWTRVRFGLQVPPTAYRAVSVRFGIGTPTPPIFGVGIFSNTLSTVASTL